MIYPNNYDYDDKFEYEEQFDSYRHDLLKVFQHQLQMHPQAVVELVTAHLQLIQQRTSLSLSLSISVFL